MIDLHCHILPEIDDGAPSLSDALEMARMAADSGVRAVVATPHCNLPAADNKNYLDETLMAQVTRLRSALEQAQIPLRLYAGAEVFCTPELPRLLENNRLLPLAGSRYLLMEFFFDEDPGFMEYCFDTVFSRGMIPVVAHPERYDAVQYDPYLVHSWFARGTVIQLNKGSLLGRLGSRAESTSHWILQRGLAHVVASDAHHPEYRTPHMSQIRDYLEYRCGPEYTRILLNGNPGRILRDQKLFSPERERNAL